MRRVFTLLLVLAVSSPLLAQSLLKDATEAWRQGDFPKAARLFAAAADGETDPGRRADIRVKLAWTYFLMKNRNAAEEALIAALGDRPGLELDAGYYTDDFLALFRTARTRAFPTPAPSPTPTPLPSPADLPAALASLRQQLAEAVDAAAEEAVLSAIQNLEPVTPPAQFPDLLEVKADALEQLGRGDAALEERGRVAALRVIAQAPAGATPWPLETLLEARRLLANGLPADASALMRGVLRELPSCGPALEVLGEASLASGRLDEAYSALQTALIANESPDLLLALGEVEMRRGRASKARDFFRRATDADAGNDRAWASLGLLAASLGDYPSAGDALDKALVLNGTLFEALVVRAELALMDADIAGAVQHLQRALQVRPDDPWAAGWLGVAYLDAGNLTGAEARLRLGQQSDPATFTVPLAETLRRLGKVDEALRLVADGEDLDPYSSALVRARCLLDRGQSEEAVRILAGLISQRPGDGRTEYLLGYGYHSLRRWDEAVETLRRASDMRGASPVVTRGLRAAEITAAAQRLMDTAVVVPPPPSEGTGGRNPESARN
jgi:tetratricopeptide (TPR) repeat protein